MISRREWLALVGKLGVIGAAASLGLSLPAHAVTRPTATLNPLFLNVSPRPVISSRTAPRLVENLLAGVTASSTGRDLYFRGTGSDWTDFPASTPNIVWGNDVDGGQWLQFTSEAAGVQRVWVNVGIGTIYAGQTIFCTFTVDSKTGTHVGNNASVTGVTLTGGTNSLNNIGPGRYAIWGYCTVGGTMTIRLGIGTDANNANNATIRISDIMVERVPFGTTYPSEYVRPGDQRIFNYTRTGTMTSGAVGTPTHGAPYPIPRRSHILVLGDSFANDAGDFHTHLRAALSGRPIASNGLGVAGHTISQITDQISSGIARLTTGASTYTLCIAHGGVNDVAQNRTLAQMQTDRLAQIAAIEAAGMLPVLLTTSPLNAATAGQQTVMDGYNAWIKTLGYPTYDLFTDASNGSGDFNTAWASLDGVHPTSPGYRIMGQRLADLIQLIGD